MERDILIDAIIGKGLLNSYYAEKKEKEGLVDFTGNQWNEDWSWNRRALNKLATKKLETLYYENQDIDPPIIKIDPEVAKMSPEEWFQWRLDQVMFEILTGDTNGNTK